MALKPKRLIRFIPILIIATFISGCWNYREIDDQIIIAGSAVDYDKESNQLLLTTEISLPTSSKDKDFVSKVYQGKGRNIAEAIVDLRSKAGRNLLWSHSKVIIFGNELMQQQKLFIGTLDWIKRNQEMRDTLWLLSSAEKTAGEIFEKSQPQTQKITAFFLDYLFLTRKSESFVSIPFWKFITDLQSSSNASTLPLVGLINSPSTGTLPLIAGTEMFNATKTVNRLDDNQTKMLLLLTNNLNQAIFAPEQSKSKEFQTVSLKVTQSRTTIEPERLPHGLAMKIQVMMEAQIQEIDSETDIFKPDKLKKIQQGIATVIADKISAFVKTIQNDQCDVIGLGNKVAIKYPELWNSMKKRWGLEFAKIPAKVHVELLITGSEQSMGATKVRQ